jgi:hypothetical protein
MSLVTDILDRLSHLAVVKAQLDTTAGEVRRMSDWLLDLEKRVVRLESATPPSARPTPKRPRLPRK